jgi:hypothetical protein
MTGNVKKRLKNESDVMAIGLTNNASRVIIGRGKDELHIWDPMYSRSLKKIKGYRPLRLISKRQHPKPLVVQMLLDVHSLQCLHN